MSFVSIFGAVVKLRGRNGPTWWNRHYTMVVKLLSVLSMILVCVMHIMCSVLTKQCQLEVIGVIFDNNFGRVMLKATLNNFKNHCHRWFFLNHFHSFCLSQNIHLNWSKWVHRTVFIIITHYEHLNVKKCCICNQ